MFSLNSYIPIRMFNLFAGRRMKLLDAIDNMTEEQSRQFASILGTIGDNLKNMAHNDDSPEVRQDAQLICGEWERLMDQLIIRDEPVQTPWERFNLTKQEKGSAIHLRMDTMRYDLYELALSDLQQTSELELLSYIDPDVGETCRVLALIKTGEASAEFLRVHEEGREYSNIFDFAHRFGLMHLDSITKLGSKYIKENL